MVIVGEMHRDNNSGSVDLPSRSTRPKEPDAPMILDKKVAWSLPWLTSLTDQGVESNFQSVVPMLTNRKTVGT